MGQTKGKQRATTKQHKQHKQLLDDDGSADSFLNSLKPSTKEEIDEMYNSFVSDIKQGKFKDQIDAMYNLLKIKEGSLTKLLKDFKENVIIRNTRHKNTNEFFINFSNWLNVQDRNKLLDKYKKN